MPTLLLYALPFSSTTPSKRLTGVRAGSERCQDGQDGASAFNDLRRQPEYRAALDRGAAEIWMPSLPQAVALAVEKARVSFGQARDGEAPAGKRAAAITLLERSLVRDWLAAMDAEFGVVESWMPWT